MGNGKRDGAKNVQDGKKALFNDDKIKFPFYMRPRISIRGSVRPSAVGSWVRGSVAVGRWVCGYVNFISVNFTY